VPAGSLAIVLQVQSGPILSMCTTVLLIIWTPDFREVFLSSSAEGNLR